MTYPTSEWIQVIFLHILLYLPPPSLSRRLKLQTFILLHYHYRRRN